jgi:Flp pilus assembly protein TadG
MNKKVSQRQKGQAIVLVALMIVVLTGMLALSVDVGNSYGQRRMLQTAADAAAMAGTHLAMEQVTNAGGTQNYTAQRTTAIQFANRNGASAPDTITIVWVDNTGAAFANNVSNLPIIPVGKVAQGMKVTIVAFRNTFLFRTFGIQQVGVTVSAMAQFGTANAIVGAAPLLMNRDTVIVGTGPTSLYTPVLVTTDNGGPACCSAGQLDSLGYLIPAAFVAPPPPVNNFHILNDPPTSAASPATRSSAANGITGTLSIGPSYYIDPAGQPANDNFALGMNDRILRSIANPVFAGDLPQPGKFSPYNPRVFMTGVNTSAGGTNPTPIYVFLAFYLQFVVYDTSTHKIVIGGYWVNSSGVPGSGGFGLPTGGTGNPMVFRLTQ